jgi:hypothetical protein
VYLKCNAIQYTGRIDHYLYALILVTVPGNKIEPPPHGCRMSHVPIHIFVAVGRQDQVQLHHGIFQQFSETIGGRRVS